MNAAKYTVRGFTLIELLVVISIISVLATLGLLVGPMAIQQAKIAKAKAEIGNLALCISGYKTDYGIYPDDTSAETVINSLTGYKSSPDAPEEGLANDPDWHGPYLASTPSQHELGMKNKALIDAWRQPYQFKLRKPVHNIGGMDIWSSGPNMQNEEGGGDDITNWK